VDKCKISSIRKPAKAVRTQYERKETKPVQHEKYLTSDRVNTEKKNRMSVIDQHYNEDHQGIGD
jgi:hypothetical protein